MLTRSNIVCYVDVGSAIFEQDVPGNRREHVLPICINIQVGPHLNLKDRFDWDLTNPDNSPEEFAAVLVSDFLHQGILKEEKTPSLCEI